MKRMLVVLTVALVVTAMMVAMAGAAFAEPPFRTVNPGGNEPQGDTQGKAHKTVNPGGQEVQGKKFNRR